MTITSHPRLPGSRPLVCEPPIYAWSGAATSLHPRHCSARAAYDTMRRCLRESLCTCVPIRRMERGGNVVMQLPSRADHVGSLLRPVALREARAQHAAGTLSAEAFRQIEDRYIREAIDMQEEIGLQAVTDGEYRRAFWHYDFLGLYLVYVLTVQRQALVPSLSW